MKDFRRFVPFTLLFALLLTLIGVGGSAALPEEPAAAAGWQEVGPGSASGGGIAQSDGWSYAPSVAVGSDGPVVAWEDAGSGNLEIYVRRWNGFAWVEMGEGSASGGGISNNDGTSLAASLAVGPDGPVVAWYDDSGGDWEIYVRRWNGSAWVELGGSASGGGISNNEGGSFSPSVAVGPDGPVVAWEDDSSGDLEIYIRRWNGAAWVEMGGSASAGGVSDNEGGSGGPSMAVGPDGPMVAWNDTSDGDLEIYLRRWNGSAWVEMGGSASGGGISNNGGLSYEPSLAVGPDGPVVAWHDDISGDLEIYARRWNGSAWVDMAGSAFGGGVSNNDGESGSPSVAVGPDGPLVAWTDSSDGDDDIYLRRWNGAAWVEMDGSAAGGGVSDNNTRSFLPSLAVGPSGPVLAWADGNGDIYVRRLGDAGWVEIGPGSASGGGIAQTGGWSASLSVAVGPDGPVVAWANHRDSDAEIYVRRWNGSAWVELGGSASGGGISNNEGESFLAALVVGLDGPFVVWQDDSSGDYEIYLRRWNGAAWVEMAGSASGGGISDNEGRSFWPSVAVGPDGPVVTWEDDSSGNWEIYARRWNGSAWVEMGGSASGGGISNSGGWAYGATVAVGSDGPMVAWTDESLGIGEIFVRRWNGSAWVEMGTGSASGGGISNTIGASYGLSLAVGPDGPIAAWQDDTAGDAEIYIRRWNGAAWVEIGSGSASGGGVSDNDGWSYFPALAVGPDGPIVAWQDDSNGDAEIYARRWNGAAWVEMGSGSASGGGISDNGGWSYSPALAAGRDGPVVAWNDGNGDIFVRRAFRAYAYIPAGLTACFAGPNEREPNNENGGSIANGPLCASGTYSGLPNDRRDFFMFNTIRSGDIRIKLTDYHGIGMQLQLRASSSNGPTVAADTNQSDGLSVELANAAPGRYYIYIFTETPNPAETRPYAMEVTYP